MTKEEESYAWVEAIPQRYKERDRLSFEAGWEAGRESRSKDLHTLSELVRDQALSIKSKDALIENQSKLIQAQERAVVKISSLAEDRLHNFDTLTKLIKDKL